MNSGAPVAVSSSAQRFSLRCRAGSTKAQIWHSHTGLDPMMPATREIFSWNTNAPPIPVSTAVDSIPLSARSGRISSYGPVRKVRISS